MDLEKIASDLAVGALVLAGTWGVIKAQVADLRLGFKEHDEAIRGRDGIETRLTRLESDQGSHARSLEDTVKKLERVTSDLQALMLDIARSGTGRQIGPAS